MNIGRESIPGKELRDTPTLKTDKNGSVRLEMARDHPMLVQNSITKVGEQMGMYLSFFLEVTLTTPL